MKFNPNWCFEPDSIDVTEDEFKTCLNFILQQAYENIDESSMKYFKTPGWLSFSMLVIVTSIGYFLLYSKNLAKHNHPYQLFAFEILFGAAYEYYYFFGKL